MSLPGLYTQYRSLGMEFLAVIVDDDSGNRATAAFANTYAERDNFNFATIPDPNGYWRTLMGPSGGYPTNMLIDLRTMQLLYVRSGLMSPTGISDLLDSFLQ